MERLASDREPAFPIPLRPAGKDPGRGRERGAGPRKGRRKPKARELAASEGRRERKRGGGEQEVAGGHRRIVGESGTMA